MASGLDNPSPAYLAEYIGDRLKNVAITFAILDVSTVILRFYSRRLQGRKPLLDDWLILLGLIFILAVTALSIVGVVYGGSGRHLEYVLSHPDMFILWYKVCIIAIPVVYIFGAALPKLSILVTYLQVLTDRTSRVITYAIGTSIILNALVMIPFLIWKCGPISWGWNSALHPDWEGGWCVNLEPRCQYASLANIITDAFMLLVPLPTIWRLHVGRTTKLGLFATFALGGIGLITSCFRISAFLNRGVLADGPYSSVLLDSWSLVEPSIYLMAACLLAYRPLALWIIKKRPVTELVARFRRFRNPESASPSGSPSFQLRSERRERPVRGPYSIFDTVNDTYIESTQEGRKSFKEGHEAKFIVVQSDIHMESCAASRDL